jgi:hypothetical protein
VSEGCLDPPALSVRHADDRDRKLSEQ